MLSYDIYYLDIENPIEKNNFRRKNTSRDRAIKNKLTINM